MQLELFKKLSYSHYEDGLECNNCGIVQPVDNFPRMPSGEIKRRCNTCKRNQSVLVRHLKTLHPYPDDTYCCPICDRGIKELEKKGQLRLKSWVLDHCHDTETFRGWVCSNCNTGLGAFKDDVKRITRAKNYLENHIQKQKEK